MRLTRSFLVLHLATACTTPNPNYCPNGSCIDAAPNTTIRVSMTGDDAADGLNAPVKTLKRAIELAKTNSVVKTIQLDAGKYDAATGEVYPYTVPAGIRVAGAPGTVLAGATADVGLTLDTGAIENLQLDGFKTAVHVTGTATLTGITMTASQIGVVVDGTAKLTATAVTFAGTSGQCNVGIRAAGTAEVTVDTMVATNLISVHERDQAVVSIAKGTISGGSACDLISASGNSLSLTDTTLSGGNNAISLNDAVLQQNLQLIVTLKNTVIADAASYGVFGAAATFTMTGGELRNAIGGVNLYRTMSTFTNVSVKNNQENGIYVHDDGSLAMRGCTVQGNGDGVRGSVSADLGTIADPGNNTFVGNVGVGLSVYSNPLSVSAVGNTWNSLVQGSTAQGKYGSQMVSGPIPRTLGNNYAIDSSIAIRL